MSISSSSSSSSFFSDDDLDVLSLLKSTKAPTTLQELTSKRPNLFEDNDGFKRLKAPPKTEPPPFFEKSFIETLKKSEELSKLHVEDDAEALKFLAKQDSFRDILESQLSKEALKNNEFVEYLVSHHKELKLYDFYYLKKPMYAKLTDEEPDLEMGLVAGKVPFQKGDVYNELDIRKIELIQIEDVELDDFLERIGINKDSAELQKITAEQIILNPYEKLQNPLIILTKFGKFINHIKETSFNSNIYEKIIRVLAFIMIDKNVFSKSLNQEINDILLTLIKWQYNHDKIINVSQVLNIWSTISEFPSYTYRIVESLDPIKSNITRQLKLQLCLNLVTGFTDFQYYKDKTLLQQTINRNVCSKVDVWLAKKFNEIPDGEADQFFHDLRIRFQALMTIIEHESLHNQEGNDLNLVKLKGRLVELHDKIHISYQKSEQAVLRSVLFLINTKLKSERL